MSSTELEPATKPISQGGQPIQRQATGLSVPTAPTGPRVKGVALKRKLRKERSMRIPVIENNLMNRIGITRARKATVRAASIKTNKDNKSRTRTSPYKSMLVGIARNGTQAPSIAEGSRSSTSVNLVRCASPQSVLRSPPSNTAQSPQKPATPVAAGTKGKKQINTPPSSIVLRPLPSRVAASSARPPVSRAPLDPPARVTRSSSGASPSTRPASNVSRKRSPLASSPLTRNSTSRNLSPSSPPTPVATSLQKVSASAKFSKESDSQSDGHSASDAASDVGSAGDVAQAAAIKQSLLSQIEERNEDKKWDHLLSFFHGLAPGEVSGLLKTAKSAGQKALRRLAGKETAEADSSNIREDDARVLDIARQPQREGTIGLPFHAAGSDGSGEATNQAVVPPRQKQFLYKAKGKARARSPSPIVDSALGASTSASRSIAPKRARSPEENDYDDDPPAKRRKARPLKREGAFYEYPPPSTAPTQQPEDTEPEMAVHVNLIASFLDHAQDFDVSGWLPRAGDPFDAHEEDEEDWAATRMWSLEAAARRRRLADDDTPRPAFGGRSSSAA